ncbi:hypothetical protein PHSC3_001809 [Chlamydiales bacterium STE3]|nr:hypothetical protein PHSC3_001809 [Chlamydiales bacterium STE3]
MYGIIHLNLNLKPLIYHKFKLQAKIRQKISPKYNVPFNDTDTHILEIQTTLKKMTTEIAENMHDDDPLTHREGAGFIKPKIDSHTPFLEG